MVFFPLLSASRGLFLDGWTGRKIWGRSDREDVVREWREDGKGLGEEREEGMGGLILGS